MALIAGLMDAIFEEIAH